jgi:PHD/YefM family antitoxin component YafN of YafNO toxin-antitoxin module
MSERPVPDPEPTVAAKDFQRRPGRYQRLARAQPLTITAHGEASLVMMSIEEYRRLKRQDRRVVVIDELSDEQADELLAALRQSKPSPEAAAFNDELEDGEG